MMSVYNNIRSSTGVGYKNNIGMLEDVARVAGVDLNLLKSIGGPESGWNPKAKNPNGSASGLFQFIGSTWNSMLNRYGHKYGLGKGTSVFDARANALMAAEFVKEHIANIRRNGREVNPTEVYMNHFLGHGGYNKFVQAMRKNPNASVASIMDNKTIGINKVYTMTKGRVNTVQEMYNAMARTQNKHGTATGSYTPTHPTAYGNLVQDSQASNPSLYISLDSELFKPQLPSFESNPTDTANALYSLGNQESSNSTDIFNSFGSVNAPLKLIDEYKLV